MIKRFSLLLILCCLTTQVKAQKKYKPTPEDIALAKEYKSQFEDENIVILDKHYEVSFEKNGRKETVGVIVEERTEYLNISSSARLQHSEFYDTESQVEDFKAFSRREKELFVLVHDEYMKSEDLFHTDYRVKYVNLRFPLQGHKTTVTTRKVYNDIKYFTTTYFSDTYRVLQGTINITIPGWLSYDIKEFNFDDFIIDKRKVNQKDENITYTFKNIPPQSQEQFSPGPSFLYPHIIFIAKSFKKGKETIPLFNSTEDLYGWYSSLVKEVEVDATVFQETVEHLVDGKDTDAEKMGAIYYWVQDNIRYVAFEDGIAGFKPDTPQNVFKKKYGDCKGMAILMKEMLKVAGFDARLVWIGTDRLAYDYTTPSLSVDNHMICAVKIADDYLFLDGTEKFGKLGDTATRIQLKEALVENGDSFELKKVPSNNNTSNYEHTTYNVFIEDEVLKGSVVKAFEGESKVSFQNSFYSLGIGDQAKVLSNYLAGANDNYTVDRLESFNASSREETIIINYEVSIENAVSSFDGKLYIDLDPFKRAENFIFEDRKTDLKLPLLEMEQTVIELSVPKGYKIEKLPASYTKSNELVDIQYTYEQSGGNIIFKKMISPRKRTITLADLELWNASFKELKEASDEQLTLSKKS